MTDKNPITAEEIRAEAIMVAAKEIGSWESNPSPNSRHFNCAGGVVDALAEAGLLPTEIEREYRCAGAADCQCEGDPLEPCSYTSDPVVLRRIIGAGPMFGRYITAWREVGE